MVRPVQMPAQDSQLVDHLTRDSGGLGWNPGVVRHSNYTYI